MPLRTKGKKCVSANIRELEHSKTEAGKKRSHVQNVAIAHKSCGQSRRSQRGR